MFFDQKRVLVKKTGGKGGNSPRPLADFFWGVRRHIGRIRGQGYPSHPAFTKKKRQIVFDQFFGISGQGLAEIYGTQENLLLYMEYKWNFFVYSWEHRIHGNDEEFIMDKRGRYNTNLC